MIYDEMINPDNEKGKIVLIVRMGAKKINELFPKLLKQFKKSNLNIVWSCDPMHANIEKSKSGYKTRNFKNILSEVKSFFKIHKRLSTNFTTPFILFQFSINVQSFVLPHINDINFTRLDFFSFFNSSCSKEFFNSDYSNNTLKNSLKKVQKNSLRLCILNSSFVHKKSQHHYKKD